MLVRSAGALYIVECNTGRAAMARHVQASRRRRAPARTYAFRRTWDVSASPQRDSAAVARGEAVSLTEDARQGWERSDAGHSIGEGGEQNAQEPCDGGAGERPACNERHEGKAMRRTQRREARKVRSWTGTERHGGPGRGDVSTGARSRLHQGACPDLPGAIGNRCSTAREISEIYFDGVPMRRSIVLEKLLINLLM